MLPTMSSTRIAFLLLLVVASCFPEDKPPKRIDLKDLSTAEIIGRTGKPLGQIIKITGVVVSGDDTRDLANYGRYVLQVSRVDDQDLDSSLLMHFVLSPNFEGPMAATFSETWMLTGLGKLPREEFKKAYTAEEFQKAHNSYVGKTFTVYAIECATISGIKPGKPAHPYTAGIWQSCSFDVSTRLIVMQIAE